MKNIRIGFDKQLTQGQAAGIVRGREPFFRPVHVSPATCKVSGSWIFCQFELPIQTGVSAPTAAGGDGFGSFCGPLFVQNLV